MTLGWFKPLVALGVAMLVGCATPPQPTAAPALQTMVHGVAPPRADAPFMGPQAPVEPAAIPVATIASNAAVAPAPLAPNRSSVVPTRAVTPLVVNVARVQHGRASWYGKNFEGRRTASGERFSAMGLTAAHRTLPIPSYVRVRHVASGKEVVVRINDRGPFHANRVLDLSYAAALKLGIVSVGSAEVEIEPISIEEARASVWSQSESTAAIP